MLIDSILGIVNKFIPDQDAAKRLAVDMEKEFTKQMEMKSAIIQAEIRNGSGKWRVRLMYVLMTIVALHFVMYDIVPYIRTVFDLNFWIPEIPNDEHLWSFLKLGIGGYIGGRSVEKVVGIFRGR